MENTTNKHEEREIDEEMERIRRKVAEFLERVEEASNAAMEMALEKFPPFVEKFCLPDASPTEEEVDDLLDDLYFYSCNDRIMQLYKKVCRRYMEVYPRCVDQQIKGLLMMNSTVEYEDFWDKEVPFIPEEDEE